MEMKLTRPQIIETATGEKLAVVPLAEYEAMVRAAEAAEDAADAVVARAALADLASGVDEIMPGDVTDRLVAGDNPVRVWRAYRGLTATALAKRASITQAYLSQIETGKRDGTLTVMAVLARELGVDLDDLVPVAQRPGD
jgi:DNA-binding XRE family transcriptional regulator